jgi:hypothetical protein
VDLPTWKFIFLFFHLLKLFKFGETHSEAVGTDRLAVGLPKLKKNFKKIKKK